MSLDLFQTDNPRRLQQRRARLAPLLPATYKESFDAAWDNAVLFGQSFAGVNARHRVTHVDDCPGLDDRGSSVKAVYLGCDRVRRLRLRGYLGAEHPFLSRLPDPGSRRSVQRYDSRIHRVGDADESR
jgi:hypothetical protein